MRRLLAAAALLWLAGPVAAADHAAIAKRALAEHILPGYERLAGATAALADAAGTACAGSGAAGSGAADADAIEAAYQAAFDAWMGVSHIGFGPAEEDGTAFGIAFWPDTRGMTPKALGALIASENPAVRDPAAFREVSVAARGLFALDALLNDPDAPPLEAGSYRCALVAAIAVDMAATAETLLARWRDPYGPLLTTAGAPENPLYLSPQESTRALYSALTTGLQADIDLRIGRPLGTFDRPQPRRAEAWRSGRALRNVELSLAALEDLFDAAFAPELAPQAVATVDLAFDEAEAAAARIGMDIPEAVAAPQTRLRVENLRTQLEFLREAIAANVGPALGVTAGFNAMDGD